MNDKLVFLYKSDFTEEDISADIHIIKDED